MDYGIRKINILTGARTHQHPYYKILNLKIFIKIIKGFEICPQLHPHHLDHFRGHSKNPMP